jgi:cytochrome c peroxidase
MNRKFLFVTIFFLAGIVACRKEVMEIFVGFQQPSNFPAPVYRLADNAITKEGFELGRKLFYDPILSGDNSISCGSCHIQSSAFTQHGHSLSHGIADRLGTRNSPPIMNLAWNPTFMWDGGIFDLDLQPIAPITNHVEMEETVANVLAKMRNGTTYPALFKKAFGSEEISSTRFLKALSQFMVMCVSSNAKYDSVMRSQSAFSSEELAGYNLFKSKCGTCHKEPLFTDNSFRNNGLSISLVNDIGRGAVTLHDSDNYKFKVPSLRNLEYTAPYMHDGRLFTLDAVLDHYTSQVQTTPNLDPLLQLTSQAGIRLTTDEKQKILSFLKTLDDKVFVADRRFSEQ